MSLTSSNDDVLDLAIDMLLRPGTTFAEREIIRRSVAKALRGKRSRLLPDPDPRSRFRYSDHLKAKAWRERRRAAALETV